MRVPLPRRSLRARLYASGKRADFAGLSRTRLFAGIDPDFRGVAQHGRNVAQKKARSLPPLETPLAPAQPQDTLELDERWGFVGHRRLGVIWLWLALCRRRRQSVAYALGPRDDATARLLWGRIPLAYRHRRLHPDPLESDHNVLPAGQPHARYPKRGLTNPIERFNNTLRQRLGRLVRKTLSFSKSLPRHEIAIRLFLHQCNLTCSSQ